MRIKLLMLFATIGFIASANGAAVDTATTVAPSDAAQPTQAAVWTPRKPVVVCDDNQIGQLRSQLRAQVLMPAQRLADVR